MARGVNKVILVGNLGKDPETRMTANGNAVSNITVATTKSWRDKESGEQKERTEWHRVVFFNRLAEIVDQYLRKGAKVYIEGELQTRDWERDGQKHYMTEIVAREMQMLDSKGADGSDFSSSPSGTSAPDDSSPPSSDISTPDDSSPDTSTPKDSSPPQDSGSLPDDDFDDDIPF